MNELSKLLQENLNIEFISATLSNPKNKDGVQKVKVRPILKKDVLYFQLESFRNNQAFHENVEEKKACEILLKYMENMRQMQMETQRAAYTILVSKKGKVTIKSKMKKGEKKRHAKEDNNIEASIKRCEAALRVSPTLGRLLDGFATESANSEKDHPEKEDKEGV